MIAPVVRSMSAHDQKPVVLTLTGSGCSKGTDLTGAAGGGAASRVVRGEAGGEPVRGVGAALERRLSKTPICQRNGKAAATRATANTATMTTTRLRMQRETSAGLGTRPNRVTLSAEPTMTARLRLPQTCLRVGLGVTAPC